MSPISETKIKVNAAVKPDFASAFTSAEGPPFKKTTSEDAIVHTSSILAIDSW